MPTTCIRSCSFFFFNDTPTTEIYTFPTRRSSDLKKPCRCWRALDSARHAVARARTRSCIASWAVSGIRSEEHTSELQSHSDLVCRLLLEKKKKKAIKR